MRNSLNFGSSFRTVVTFPLFILLETSSGYEPIEIEFTQKSTIHFTNVKRLQKTLTFVINVQRKRVELLLRKNVFLQLTFTAQVFKYMCKCVNRYQLCVVIKLLVYCTFIISSCRIPISNCESWTRIKKRKNNTQQQQIDNNIPHTCDTQKSQHVRTKIRSTPFVGHLSQSNNMKKNSQVKVWRDNLRVSYNKLTTTKLQNQTLNKSVTKVTITTNTKKKPIIES